MWNKLYIKRREKKILEEPILSASQEPKQRGGIEVMGMVPSRLHEEPNKQACYRVSLAKNWRKDQKGNCETKILSLQSVG